MEEQIKKAFESANYMAVLASQKKILKEEYYQSLLYYENGGVFFVTKELINFSKTLIDFGNLSDVILIDNNDSPILIVDLEKFLTEVLAIYTSATNGYYNKFSNLKSSRTVEKLINL